jgi:hypothetical protein
MIDTNFNKLLASSPIIGSFYCAFQIASGNKVCKATLGVIEDYKAKAASNSVTQEELVTGFTSAVDSLNLLNKKNIKLSVFGMGSSLLTTTIIVSAAALLIFLGVSAPPVLLGAAVAGSIYLGFTLAFSVTAIAAKTRQDFELTVTEGIASTNISLDRKKN